jgi:hypothetical protein
MPPIEGDPVFINGVTVAPNGVVWWSSSRYGVASFDDKIAKPGFTYFNPASIGVAGSVSDIVALPDGRIAIGSNGGGVTFWDPPPPPWENPPHTPRPTTTIRAGAGLPDNQVNRLQLDTMVNPPVLHVSTGTGGAAIRVFP